MRVTKVCIDKNGNINYMCLCDNGSTEKLSKVELLKNIYNHKVANAKLVIGESGLYELCIEKIDSKEYTD